ncbi:hypothetical protein Tco_1546929 [Tanacetum coccineum]
MLHLLWPSIITHPSLELHLVPLSDASSWSLSESLIRKILKAGGWADYPIDLSTPSCDQSVENVKWVPYEFFINIDLRIYKGEFQNAIQTRLLPRQRQLSMQSRGDVYSIKRILAVTHVKLFRSEFEDLQLGVESCQKEDQVISMIYKTDIRKRHCLHSIQKPSRNTKNIDMEYLPREEEQLEKKRAHFMIRTLTSCKVKENIRVILLTVKMEILLEPTSNKLMFDESDTYVLERFDTSARNPGKEILHKLNLPDHKSILMDSKVTPTNHRRMTNPYSSPIFIANCFNVGHLKMEVKVPDSS